jgi:methyl-accepting chemotaxis protein
LPIAPEVAQRLQNYRIDQRARDLLRSLAPLVEPIVGPAIDRVMASAGTLSSVSALWRQHGADVRRVEIVQYKSLLRAEFDPDYYATCRATVDAETSFGFEGGARLNIAASFVQMATQAIAHKHWLGGSERTAVLSQAVMFDLATTAGLYVQVRERAVETRRAAIDEAINNFNATIGGVLTSINEASGSLSGASAAMQQTASSATGLLKSASELSAQTSESVEIAVTAADNMAESIKEIRQQTAHGLEMARSAATDTAKTNSTIRALDQATQEIGSIVELISKIAAQTNLLALNATIEAARAGGMGKGFAVVASEVKALANQTSAATDQISHQINAIQEATRKTAQEISSVARSINELTDAARKIDAAVEEQAVTTQQIASSMQVAAVNTGRTTKDVTSVEQASSSNLDAVRNLTGWAERLSATAQDVERQVADFFARVRGAA